MQAQSGGGRTPVHSIGEKEGFVRGRAIRPPPHPDGESETVPPEMCGQRSALGDRTPRSHWNNISG